jgi:hypothetical protein
MAVMTTGVGTIAMTTGVVVEMTATIETTIGGDGFHSLSNYLQVTSA